MVFFYYISETDTKISEIDTKKDSDAAMKIDGMTLHFLWK